MNHPNGNLENILTFMWCLWKSRNDNLFNGKNGHPTQIYLMANAIKQNLEMLDNLQDNKGKNRIQDNALFHNQLPHQGLKAILLNLICRLQVQRFFSDAAWKTKKAPGMASKTSMGIGVYCQIQEGTPTATVMIQDSIPTA
jgi:hypothetical protein